MEPVIIYEDERMLAITKPSGLVVHAGVGTKQTLSDWVIATYPALSNVGEPYLDAAGNTIPRPGIVHRLDKETSGVLLLAKNQEAFHELKTLFKKGKVFKEYHAFVYGRPKRDRGTVRLPIGRSKSDFRKQATRSMRGGRDACTEYTFIKSCKDNTSLLAFFPKTGRTHQIRIHARELQTPIICDNRYAPRRDHLLGFTRLALHARRLTLKPHHLAEPIDIIAPYPDDFAEADTYCTA